MGGPRISIVVAVLNGAPTIQRCLDSVLVQTYRDWEIVVIDGRSTDGTRSILERNAGHISYWESGDDRGIYHAWNKALAHASGEWLLFLGADDRLRSPDGLARAATALDDADGRYRVIYASVDVVSPVGVVRLTRGLPWPEVRAEFMNGMAIPHQATFHHRGLFEVHGTFDESFRICGDYELLLRELQTNDALFIPDLVLVEMGAGGLSDRAENRVTMTREFQRARRMHGLTRVPGRLSLPVFRARFRAWLARTLGPRAAESVASAYRSVVHRGRR